MNKLNFNYKLLKQCIDNKAKTERLKPMHIRYQIESTLGITKQTMKLWLSGGTMPETKHLFQLSDFFNVDMVDFVIEK